ncbi:MAG: pantetheine-phosphate adenylyltransferase [Clostridia bacterium]
MKIAIYPGSFDPITLGHIDILERATKIFDKVILCVMINLEKKPTFTIEQKLDMIRASVLHIDNVEVDFHDGLLIDYAKKHNIDTIIKGLRSSYDLEMEHQMASLNNNLCPTLDTLFLLCRNEHRFLSSTVVRQLMGHNGDISSLVSKETFDYIQNLKENS